MPVTPLGIGVTLFVVLLVIVAALVWQEMRSRRSFDSAVYWLPEAVPFVRERLEPETAERLSEHDVRLILEWGIHYHQVVAPRTEGTRPVLGSGEAMDYILERGREEDRAYDPFDIADVMAAEIEYLVEIGAVGTPVEDESS
jgi:hypothetical protein